MGSGWNVVLSQESRPDVEHSWQEAQGHFLHGLGQEMQT